MLTIFAAIILSFRMAFGAIGTTIYVAVLQGRVPTEMAKHVVPAALAGGLPATSLPDLFSAIAAGFQPDAVAAVKGLTPDILLAVSNAVLDGYSAAYAYVYYASLAFSGFALIVSFFSMDYDKLFTGHVSRQIHKRTRKSEVDKAPLDIAKATAV
jgi:hypothetical protein